VPAGYGAAIRIRGDVPPALNVGQALVENKYAAKHDLARGDTFTVTTAAGKPVQLTVAGFQRRLPIETIDSLLAKVIVGQSTFDTEFPKASDQYVFVKGPRDAKTTRAINRAIAGFPGVDLKNREDWIDDRVNGINTLLNLLYVLLALSVVVSLFGMVNTLVLSVFERTREIGMLRAVGMSRRQVRRMVRHESVITALIGAVLGIAVGLALAAGLTAWLGKYGFSFAVPAPGLLAVAIIAALAGMAAAALPARRAARVNVLNALAYE
jgi:putative ABC transport system permease protein